MLTKEWDTLWINGLLVRCEQGYDLLSNSALAVKDGKIAWIGEVKDLPAPPTDLAQQIYDLNGQCLTPALIDCHTHLVYAGNRAAEFEMRLNGVSYEEITRKGGGIHATVNATRLASEEELLAQSLPRAQALLNSGAGTIEIKSGYGLDLATELKILRVAQKIGEILPLTVYKTFLGAHTIPNEYKNNPDKYVDLICEEMIPLVAKEKLADSVDVFCEKIAFNLTQTEKVFATAQQYGLAIKCHSEQLSDSGSAVLAAKYKAVSVDHLEYATRASIEALAASGTTAVLLPGAFYFLREKQLPPIELLREYKIPMALASDANPGTSPILSLPIILNMACTLFRLTPEEALLGVTHHAAKALGMADSRGSLTVGKVADFAVWNVSHPSELAYYIGGNFLQRLVKSGNIIYPLADARGSH